MAKAWRFYNLKKHRVVHYTGQPTPHVRRGAPCLRCPERRRRRLELTGRQFAIVMLVTAGFTSPEIAARLGGSEYGVRQSLSREIYPKLGVKSRVQLANLWIRCMTDRRGIAFHKQVGILPIEGEQPGSGCADASRG